jgi:DNA-binding GntR family transcriptional regulator
MRILEGEGLIYRVPGLGYYISDLRGSSQAT